MVVADERMVPHLAGAEALEVTPRAGGPMSIALLDGNVSLGVSSNSARPVTSSRRSTRPRLAPVRERVASKDSDEEEDAPPGVSNDVLAPRLTRRGVPRRRSREPSPTIAKKATSPNRIAPLALTRTGASDLLGNLQVSSSLSSSLTCRAPVEVSPATAKPAAHPPAADTVAVPTTPATSIPEKSANDEKSAEKGE